MSHAEADIRQIFADDSALRLDRLGELLLEFEHEPGKPEVLSSMFREAHSLKGAAGVLGLSNVSEVAHALEGPLERLRSGSMRSSPALTDGMLAAIDGLRTMVAVPAIGADDTTRRAVIDGLVHGLGAEVAGGAAPVTPPPDAPQSRQSPPETHNATMQVAVERLDQIDRLVGESASAHLRVGQLLAERLSADPGTLAEFRDLARLLSRLQEVTMRTRMVPLATIIPSLHRTVRDVARATGKQVRWEVEGAETEIDRSVLDKLHDPLIHLVRNAVDHGVESPERRRAAGKPAEGLVRLSASQKGAAIVISISDDGAGIPLDKVRAAAAREGYEVGHMSDTEVLDLIFRPGVSTAEKLTEISGRGVGLDVVRTNLALLRGSVQVRNDVSHGSVFTVSTPITLTIVQCLVVESAGHHLALPLHSVVSLLGPDTVERPVAGKPMVVHGATAVPVTALSQALGFGKADLGPVVIVSAGDSQHAFRVGSLRGQRDIVVKGLGRLVPVVESVAGAAIEPDGAVIVVLDVAGLIATARRAASVTAPHTEPAVRHKSILVVDDALTVRELERSILERAGYAVRVAADGRQALSLLEAEPADLVLTDLEMPLMDGLALTVAIRKHQTLSQTPVVILTSHGSEQDRTRGLAAGASAYIVKTGFDQQRLLSVVDELMPAGRP